MILFCKRKHCLVVRFVSLDPPRLAAGAERDASGAARAARQSKIPVSGEIFPEAHCVCKFFVAVAFKPLVSILIAAYSLKYSALLSIAVISGVSGMPYQSAE